MFAFLELVLTRISKDPLSLLTSRRKEYADAYVIVYVKIALHIFATRELISIRNCEHFSRYD